jgi:hypothetical protein
MSALRGITDMIADVTRYLLTALSGRANRADGCLLSGE